MAIEFRVLGPLEVSIDEHPADLSSKRQRLLLSLLLTYANERVSVDRLIDGIWGDDPRERARHTLQVHVSKLRNLLEPQHQRGHPWTVIATVEDGYRLQVEPDRFDRDVFERLAAEGRRLLEKGENLGAAHKLREGLDAWRGAAFSELALERALQSEAARLEELRLSALQDRMEVDLRLGRHHEVIPELRDLVDVHPFRERLRELLMLALYRAGRQEEALRTYRSLERALGEELGIEPGHEVRTLEKQILLQDPSLDLDSPPSRPVTNLPAPTTSFVGRQRDIDETLKLLDGTRLLTFLGPGGVGKTRLALAAATAMTRPPSDGVWLVELASLRDPMLIGQAVADVLDIDQQPGRQVEATLADRLRHADMLLIFDNCEHLIEGTAALVDWLLRACPKIRVCATSREPLGIGGETRLAVSGLHVPAEEDELDQTELANCDAVRLFADRASAALARFELSPENTGAVAQICRRLDGIPLAIELAASRVTVLTPQQIGAELDHRFELLITGSRTADIRQRTLKATLDWSYDLLTEPEQAVLRRLSVFRGTFGLSAVEALCRGIDDRETATLDLLDRLVAKSLVSAIGSGTEMRYELLDTLRMYARAKLVDSGEEEEALLLHQDWYVALAERAGPELRGIDQLVWLRRMESEHDNLRAALERSYQTGDIGVAFRIVGSIAWFWFLHSNLAEGWHWFETLIAQRSDVPTIHRTRVLIAAGQFAWEQSKDDQAKQWLQEALDAARRIESRTHAGWALGYLALLATLEGRWEDGQRDAREALELFETTGNLGGAGFSLWIEAGASYFQARERGAAGGGQATELMDKVEMLLPVARRIGDRNFLGHLQWSLGIAALDRADPEDAAERLSEALQAFRELGNKSCAAHTLDQVAWLAVARGKPKRAARLLASTQTLRESLGIPGHALERRSWEACKQEVADLLHPDEYEESWADGRRMSPDQAIGYALSGVTAGAHS